MYNLRETHYVLWLQLLIIMISSVISVVFYLLTKQTTMVRSQWDVLVNDSFGDTIKFKITSDMLTIEYECINCTNKLHFEKLKNSTNCDLINGTFCVKVGINETTKNTIFTTVESNDTLTNSTTITGLSEQTIGIIVCVCLYVTLNVFVTIGYFIYHAVEEKRFQQRFGEKQSRKTA